MKLKFPHCDLATGKIYGCEKGSWKWWHEKGHFEYNIDENKSFLILLQGYSLNIWIFFVMGSVIIKILFYPALALFMIYFSLWVYEEWWCNRYANRKFYK